MRLSFVFLGALQGFLRGPPMGLQAPLRHEDETRPPDVAGTHSTRGVIHPGDSFVSGYQHNEWGRWLFLLLPGSLDCTVTEYRWGFRRRDM